MSVEDIVNGLDTASEKIELPALRQAHEFLEEAAQALYSIASEANDRKLAEVFGQWEQAIGEVARVLQLCGTVREKIAAYRASIVGSGGSAPVGSSPQPSAASPELSGKEWAEAKRKELPGRSEGKGPTTGIYRGEDGKEQTIRSGKDETTEAIKDYLTNSPTYPNVPSNVQARTVEDHAETKLAWRMRQEGRKHLRIAINNMMCHRGRRSMFTCQRAIRAILPRGSSMEVWEPDTTEPVVIQGTGEQ